MVVELDRENGKRRQKWQSGFATRRDAEKALNAMLTNIDAGTYVQPSRMTLATYLDEHWIPSRQVRETTLVSYKASVRLWIIPALGEVRLAKLTPRQIQDFYKSLHGATRKDGRGTISGRSGQYHATILSKALTDAVGMGFLARNPALGVTRPAAARTQMRHWTSAESKRFLDDRAGDRLFLAWFVLLARGLRRGELVGLRWEDVDLERARLAIVRTRVTVGYQARDSVPKTARGRRSVPLDAMLVDAFKQHRDRQRRERAVWGEAWVDTGLVFTKEDGSAIHPGTMSQSFEHLSVRAGLPPIRFHDLRHTCATLALQAGVPTRVVSEWLGHASTSITEDIYQHVIPSMMEEAGELVTRLVLNLGESEPPGADPTPNE